MYTQRMSLAIYQSFTLQLQILLNVMANVLCGSTSNLSRICEKKGSCFRGISALPLLHKRVRVHHATVRGRFSGESCLHRSGCKGLMPKRILLRTVATNSSSSDSNNSANESSNQEKASFGYNRKDVLLIGLGVTFLGIGLKSGLEFLGVDPLQAGNVVQLVLVLGLTIGWISTYMFRVSNKEMTYAQQLRDYEKKVMEKRLEGLTEAELEALLEQVEEEKRQLGSSEQVK